MRPGKQWKAKFARHAFCEAFIRPHERPRWLVGIDFHPKPHGYDHPIATFHSRIGAISVKILPHSPAVINFRERYPASKNLLIIIDSRDTPEEIRQKVFQKVGRLLA